MQRRLSHFALLVVAFVATLNSACGPPPRERLVKIAGYGQQLQAQLDANWTLPDSLLREGVIDAAKHAWLRARFENSRRLVASFNSGMSAVLATEALEVGPLISVVADLITEVQQLTAGVRGEAYRKTLLVVEMSLRAISGYFASQVRSARAAGYTDAQLARWADLKDLRVIEEYAGR
jgi:hypothetical protein